MELYIMVKKIKVVDVAPSEEANPPEQIQADTNLIEEPKQVEEATVTNDPEPIAEPAPEEKLEEEPAEEIKPNKQVTKQPVSEQYAVCEHCNKKMLMKTYRYSHKKQCESKHAPPPPPPPPSPTPEPKKKRAAPKEKTPAPKPQFDGVVSFSDYKPPPDPYVALREQRQMVRQQRVKNLIFQAI